MRKRLILAFVALAVAIVALYGVPRALIRVNSVQHEQEDLVARGAHVASVLAAHAVVSGQPVTPELLRPLLQDGERIEYRDPSGDGFAIPEGTALDEEDLLVTRRIQGGGAISYSLDSSEVDSRIFDAVAPVVLLGLGLIPLGALVGALLARRLARPFSELATTARAMGTGDLSQDVPHYDVPEAEEIATALRESSRRLADLLERERDVAVNASHELRTPITAVRLALEDVSLWPDTPPQVSAELQRLVVEVDRLSEAVSTLLDARRRWSPPAP